MGAQTKQLFTRRKPKQCPNCGASPLASILYGMPSFDDALQDKLSRGLVALGGCVVSDNDPNWQCNKCGTQIFREGNE